MILESGKKSTIKINGSNGSTYIRPDSQIQDRARLVMGGWILDRYTGLMWTCHFRLVGQLHFPLHTCPDFFQGEINSIATRKLIRKNQNRFGRNYHNSRLRIQYPILHQPPTNPTHCNLISYKRLSHTTELKSSKLFNVLEFYFYFISKFIIQRSELKE